MILRPGSRLTSGSRRNGMPTFPRRGRIHWRGRGAPKRRRPAPGRSWSPTRCASRRSSASWRGWSETSTARGSSSRRQEQELETTRQELETTRQGRTPARSPPTNRRDRRRLAGAGSPPSTTRSKRSGSSLSPASRSGRRAVSTPSTRSPTPRSGAEPSSTLGATAPSDYLLNVIELAAEQPGTRVPDGWFSDPATVSEIGQVDAVFLFDVLHRRSTQTGTRCSSCTHR